MRVKCTCTVTPPRPGLQRENNKNGLWHLAHIVVSGLLLASFPGLQSRALAVITLAVIEGLGTSLDYFHSAG